MLDEAAAPFPVRHAYPNWLELGVTVRDPSESKPENGVIKVVEIVCVCYCSTHYKAVRVCVWRGQMEDMCYERRRAETVCVHYCSTYHKAVHVCVGGGRWRTCATRDDEPRPVWTSLPIAH